MGFVDDIDRILPKRRPIGHHEVNVPIPGCHIVQELQQKLAEYCGVKHCVALSSGTAALHLALKTLGVRPGEEVLVPSLTYIASANGIRYCGAIPHFVDGHINICHFKLRSHLNHNTVRTPDRRVRLNWRTNRVISALMTVDLLGFPADNENFEKLAKDFDLVLVEDAAEALGSTLYGRKCGSFGNAGILSFNINKIVTGDGGGALLTNDEQIAAKAAHLSSVARIPHPWKVEADSLGYNYRMPSSCATLVLNQLCRLDKILASKLKLLEMYREALKDCDEAELLTSRESWQGEPNYWLITAILNHGIKLGDIMTKLHEKGIQARALFTPLHTLPMFKDCPRMDYMEFCEDLTTRAVCLPSGLGLVPDPFNRYGWA